MLNVSSAFRGLRFGRETKEIKNHNKRKGHEDGPPKIHPLSGPTEDTLRLTFKPPAERRDPAGDESDQHPDILHSLAAHLAETRFFDKMRRSPAGGE